MSDKERGKGKVQDHPNIFLQAVSQQRLGWILERLEIMQAIASRSTGNVQLKGPDDEEITVDAWPASTRRFLGKYRSRFAHGHPQVQPDGGFRVLGPEKHKGLPYLWSYTAEEFHELFDKISEAIYGKLTLRLDATVTCETCGATARATQLLGCRHVDYGVKTPPNDGTIILIHPLSRGKVTGDICVEEGPRGPHTVVHMGGDKQPRSWIRLFISDLNKGKKHPLKWPCGNTASYDGYCRRCRPEEGY